MLKKIIFTTISFLIVILATHTNAATVIVQATESSKTDVVKENSVDTIAAYTEVTPIQLVLHPTKYLNTDVYMKAKFDKFSSIGLDYPPVKREAKTYISFLIKRENVRDYNIPLSELKLIVKRDFAEKNLVNLETGDEIIIWGTVFSTALGDPWVDVENVKILTQKDKKNTDK